MRNTRTECQKILLFIVIISINVLVHSRPITDGDKNEEAISDMKTIEGKTAIEIPRKVFADLLYKGQFFQDIFSEQPTPDKIQFGHVCENPREWEQRFEAKDLKANRHQGKVRWGNEKGGYGEHYWDLNHDSPNEENHMMEEKEEQ